VGSNPTRSTFPWSPRLTAPRMIRWASRWGVLSQTLTVPG